MDQVHDVAAENPQILAPATLIAQAATSHLQQAADLSVVNQPVDDASASAHVGFAAHIGAIDWHTTARNPDFSEKQGLELFVVCLDTNNDADTDSEDSTDGDIDSSDTAD